MVKRRWWQRGKRKEAVRYGITGQSGDRPDAARLLVFMRSHRQIESGLHSVREVTAREDRGPIQTGNGPNIMAILRDSVVSLLYRAGWRAIAERLRCSSGDVDAALTRIGIPATENV
jgi:hypothetical protein